MPKDPTSRGTRADRTGPAVHAVRAAPDAPAAAGRIARLARAAASLEALLLRDRVHATARRNAWSAVCADRESARDRLEAEAVLAALGRGPGRDGSAV